MSDTKHIVIFSHGFGVRKDSRGMFTDIMAALPDCECVLFDYCERDLVADTDTVTPLTEQAKILEKIFVDVRAQYPNAIIDVVTHSQGAVAFGLFNPDGVRKAILLAPPYTLDANRTASWFVNRPGSELNFAGVSRLARRDGSTTLVPAQYWAELPTINPVNLYNKLADQTELTIINANQDEMIRKVGKENLSEKIKLVDIEGDHNFTGEAREGLVKKVREILLT